MTNTDDTFAKYNGMELDGQKFNQIFGHYTFYKFFGDKHPFKNGVNSDTNIFTPKKPKLNEGMYFTHIPELFITSDGKYYSTVLVPNDINVTVRITGNMCRASKFILNKIHDTNEINILNFDRLVQNNGDLLKFVTRQTPMLCVIAVNNKGSALQYVHQQTYNICSKAVMQDGNALKYVNKEALSELEYNNICMLAVKQCGNALQYVNNINDLDTYLNICKEAVNQNGYALYYVNKELFDDATYEDICEIAVRQNGFALLYTKFQTLRLCLAAVSQNGKALTLVKEQTYDICKRAVENDGLMLQYVYNQTRDICDAATKQNPFAIVYYRWRTHNKDGTMSY